MPKLRPLTFHFVSAVDNTPVRVDLEPAVNGSGKACYFGMVAKGAEMYQTDSITPKQGQDMQEAARKLAISHFGSVRAILEPATA